MSDESPSGSMQSETLESPKIKVATPSMYKVIMWNDDHTPMDFVVDILKRFFSKTHDEATEVMFEIHEKGSSICGIFTYEIAETKVTQVMDLARQNQHPLQCTIEKS